MRFKSIVLALYLEEIYRFCLFLFSFVFEGNFPSTRPPGAYIWRGDLTEGFLRYRFGGRIFGGAYTWRGLFSEFLRYFSTTSFAIAQKVSFSERRRIFSVH